MYVISNERDLIQPDFYAELIVWNLLTFFLVSQNKPRQERMQSLIVSV